MTHRKLERRGSLTMLMEGCDENKETINSVISKLYRKAEFNLRKAQRGIIFLDGMDKIGANVNITEFAKKQVLREILEVLDGKIIDVTRAGSTENESIDTSQIFFVCFGNFEENACMPAMNNAVRKSAIQFHQPPKFNQSPSHSDSSSSDSGTGSGEHRSSNNASRRSSSLSADQSEGYSSDEDDSFQGLRENKLAQQLLNDSRTSPISYYQSLWGMKDVQLKFTPEALEVIANKAASQNAGHEGVGIILEKLFLNLELDIVGSDITSVEINEDVVLGKKRPNYVRKLNNSLVHRKKSGKVQQSNLYAIDEEELMTHDQHHSSHHRCR